MSSGIEFLQFVFIGQVNPIPFPELSLPPILNYPLLLPRKFRTLRFPTSFP